MGVGSQSPTLSDVAERAQVSSATASRALHGDSSVSAAATSRVLAAANELGYLPRLRDIGSAAGPTIAALSHDVEEEGYGQIISAVSAAASQRGVSTFVSSYLGLPHPQLAVLQLLQTLKPTGLILSGDWLEDPAIQEELRANLVRHSADGGRIVLLGSQAFPYHSVSFDERTAGYAVGRHMGSLGRSRAIVLAGEQTNNTYALRVQGMLEALEGSGINDVRVMHSAVTRPAAAKVLGSALDDRPADMVLAVSDRLALGANTELKRRRMEIPEDVALSGLGDIPIAHRISPPLTTYSLPFASAAADITRLLLSDEDEALRSVLLRGELVVRGSSVRAD